MKSNLDNVFKSEVHVKIIHFFHENPSSIDTPRGVATWTGHSKQEVKRVLSELAATGALMAHPVSSTTGYSYTHDKKLIRGIDKRLKKYKKEGRLK